MNPRRIALALLCLATASSPRAETPRDTPQTPILDAARDPAWKDLFARLATTKDQWSLFEERRFFSFRKAAVVLKGEVRTAANRGLSLHYLSPESRIVIVDSQGLLIRNSEGRQDSVSSGRRTQEATLALVDVLRFDLGRLQQEFTLSGRREGNAWTIAFEPRDPILAAGLEAIVVSGKNSLMREISLIRSPDERVEITITETRENVTFTSRDLARYFR